MSNATPPRHWLDARAPVDTDPQETAEWREAFAALVATQGAERARFMLDELARLERADQLGWRPELNTPALNTISAQDQSVFGGDLAIEERFDLAHALERAGHGGARQQGLRRTGWAHRQLRQRGGFVRGRFQPFLPCTRGFGPGAAPERSGVFPAAQRARGVCACFSRRLLERGRPAAFSPGNHRAQCRRAGSVQLPPPLVHAGFLAVSGRLYGFGPDQQHLPRPLHAFSDRPWPARLRRPQGLGRVRRRRDGRARKYQRAHPGRARKPGQPGVGGELQPAAAGWPGARQRPHCRRAGTPVYRQRLERHQAVVGQRLGRLVCARLERCAGAPTGRHGGRENADLCRQGRAFQPRALFQPKPRAATTGPGHERRADQPPQARRPRPGQDLRRLPGRGSARGPAHGHSGAHQERLRHGCGRAGQDDHAQPEAAGRPGPDRVSQPLQPAAERRPDADLAFIKPAPDSAEMQYLQARRQALGGYLPRRQSVCEPLAVPPLASYAQFALEPGGRAMSTTMAFVRMLANLLKDVTLGPRVVPIVADEARTFGMANLFKQVGIYSNVGQRYVPEDIDSILSYREASDGQILEEGISEAGAMASWTVAATSYSVHGLAMLPFYIYYSMFGFQRVGDLIWAAADQRARGFLLGATAGRTTLAGEGLQHQDGSSHLVAATAPNCKAYDPAHAGELAVIVQAGMQQMLGQQRDVFYYITLMNENYAQPDLPESAHEGVLRGAYLFVQHDAAPDTATGQAVTLLASGAILPEAESAARQLASQGIAVSVVSVTSWSELARDGQACEGSGATSWLAQVLAQTQGPVVAATDYVRAVPEAVRAYMPPERMYRTLGTDGFGLSDTRAVLRSFFGVDAARIARTAQQALD